MEIIQKEKFFENSVEPIYINTSKKIIYQMEKCICKIYLEEGGTGTGFFLKIPFSNQSLLPVLVSTSFIIDSKAIKGDSIKISLNDDKELKEIKLKDTIRKIFIDDKLITTFIEILPEDKISDFLEIDEHLFTDDKIFENIFIKNSIYILNYLKGERAAMSPGILRRINDETIFHLCNTENGSAGGPILLLKSLKVIGFHYGAAKINKENRGILINYPIMKFQKQK